MECVINDSSHSPVGGEIIRGMCSRHYTRWWRHGDPMATHSSTGGGQQQEEHHHWRGDAASYSSFHKRVYRARGRASTCVWGCDARRYEWANLTGQYEDTADYASMCRKCHMRYDAAQWMMKPVKDAQPWVTNAMRQVGIPWGTCWEANPEVHTKARDYRAVI